MVFYLRILTVNDELEAAACHFPSINNVAVVCFDVCVISMHMCGVCLRAISDGKSEIFKSVGSRY